MIKDKIHDIVREQIEKELVEEGWTNRQWNGFKNVARNLKKDFKNGAVDDGHAKNDEKDSNRIAVAENVKKFIKLLSDNGIKPSVFASIASKCLKYGISGKDLEEYSRPDGPSLLDYMYDRVDSKHKKSGLRSVDDMEREKDKEEERRPEEENVSILSVRKNGQMSEEGSARVISLNPKTGEFCFAGTNEAIDDVKSGGPEILKPAFNLKGTYHINSKIETLKNGLASKNMNGGYRVTDKGVIRFV